jgi:hypothetical protein
MHLDMVEAIRREKQLKKWNRAWKIGLIEQENPEWCDLWSELAASCRVQGEFVTRKAFRTDWIPALAGMTGGVIFR